MLNLVWFMLIMKSKKKNQFNFNDFHIFSVMDFNRARGLELGNIRLRNLVLYRPDHSDRIALLMRSKKKSGSNLS